VCAGTVVTKHTWEVAGQIEALTGVPIELVTVRVSRDIHAYTEDNLVNTMREALRSGVCDLVVHCLDEVPVGEAPDLVYATPVRMSVKEALCAPSGETLAELPRGSRVSVDTELRAAALHALRPDLEPVMTHGSLAHRINQLFQPGSDLDAALASYGDLVTIGRTELVTDAPAPTEMPPMAGQAAIAIETRQDFLAANPWLGKALARFDDLATRLSVRAERSLLAQLAGAVSAPVGAWAKVENGHLLLAAAVVGEEQFRHRSYVAVPQLSGAGAGAGVGAGIGAGVGANISAGELAELDRVADDLGRKVAAHLLEQGTGSDSPTHSRFGAYDMPQLKAA
jgi:hydroxymethylbilane synthase